MISAGTLLLMLGLLVWLLSRPSNEYERGLETELLPVFTEGRTTKRVSKCRCESRGISAMLNATMPLATSPYGVFNIMPSV